MEETHLKMYRSMHLDAGQRRELAALWREWIHRRRMLDRDYESALSKLESLPAADDINDSFILLVSALCSGKRAAACPLVHTLHGELRLVTESDSWVDACTALVCLGALPHPG